jgi:hypothetical protein
LGIHSSFPRSDAAFSFDEPDGLEVPEADGELADAAFSFDEPDGLDGELASWLTSRATPSFLRSDAAFSFDEPDGLDGELAS